jgi:hypothetical protein
MQNLGLNTLNEWNAVFSPKTDDSHLRADRISAVLCVGPKYNMGLYAYTPKSKRQ